MNKNSKMYITEHCELLDSALLCNLQAASYTNIITHNYVELFHKQEINDTTKLMIWNSRMPYRDFLHIDDMADACIFVMNNIDLNDLIKDKTKTRNPHIDIGTEKDSTIMEQAQLINKPIGFNNQIELDITKHNGTKRKLQDVDKLPQQGWRHKIKPQSGVEQIISWYLNGY